MLTTNEEEKLNVEPLMKAKRKRKLKEKLNVVGNMGYDGREHNHHALNDVDDAYFRQKMVFLEAEVSCIVTDVDAD